MKTYSILFIEDESEYANYVKRFLQTQGLNLDHFMSATQAIDQLKKHPYDGVILDLTLPDLDGLTVCQQIREISSIPILILSARDDIANKIISFDNGADDYLVKPASLKELSTRLKRLLKRPSNPTAFSSSTFNVHGIAFDTKNRKLTYQNKSIILTKKEKSLLEYFFLNSGQVLTRTEIIDHVWGDELDPFSNTVNVTIKQIKQKLATIDLKNMITSVHGLGYKLEFPTNYA
jgi:DNA-binding response OmpR family regulator